MRPRSSYHLCHACHDTVAGYQLCQPSQGIAAGKEEEADVEGGTLSTFNGGVLSILVGVLIPLAWGYKDQPGKCARCGQGLRVRERAEAPEEVVLQRCRDDKEERARARQQLQEDRRRREEERQRRREEARRSQEEERQRRGEEKHRRREEQRRQLDETRCQMAERVRRRHTGGGKGWASRQPLRECTCSVLGRSASEATTAFRSMLADDGAGKEAAALLHEVARADAEVTTDVSILLEAHPQLEALRHRAVVAYEGCIPIQFYKGETSEHFDYDVPISESVADVCRRAGERLGIEGPVRCCAASRPVLCASEEDSFAMRLMQTILPTGGYRLPFAISVLPGRSRIDLSIREPTRVVESLAHGVGVRLEVLLPHFEGHSTIDRIRQPLPQFHFRRQCFAPGEEVNLGGGNIRLHLPGDAFECTDEHRDCEVEVELGYLEGAQQNSYLLPFAFHARWRRLRPAGDEGEPEAWERRPAAKVRRAVQVTILHGGSYAEGMKYDLFHFVEPLVEWFCFPGTAVTRTCRGDLEIQLADQGIFSAQASLPFYGEYVDAKLFSPKHDRTWGPESAGVWERGGVPYVCPIGWKRYALQQVGLNEDWAVAFHGTRPEFLTSILRDSLLRPGDRPTAEGSSALMPPAGHVRRGKEMFGDAEFTDHVFCSPCWQYAAHKAFARPFTHEGKQHQIMLQLRVNPASIKKNPETIRANGSRISDVFPNEEIEWRIRDPRDVVVYAICVREVPGRSVSAFA